MLHGESSEESSGPLKLQNKRRDTVRKVRQNWKDMCQLIGEHLLQSRYGFPLGYQVGWPIDEALIESEYHRFSRGMILP